MTTIAAALLIFALVALCVWVQRLIDGAGK
jgi:hypothetical protein